ncbi:zinc finger protein 205-like [Frankliniella occidentalis]|uniref:Zinc finger protein 205-like n=1 Tax=Frankliniella occidentalis TaxID=133901 RepID=A0A9C6WRM4_FRAOC|nr:zinc finger protein 205-like [Frankliniella occidentalis]
MCMPVTGVPYMLSVQTLNTNTVPLLLTGDGPRASSGSEVTGCSSLLTGLCRTEDLKSEGEDPEERGEPLGLVVSGCYSLRDHGPREVHDDSEDLDEEDVLRGRASRQPRPAVGEDAPEDSRGRDEAEAKCGPNCKPGVWCEDGVESEGTPQNGDERDKGSGTSHKETCRVECPGAGLQNHPLEHVDYGLKCSFCGLTCHFKSNLVRHMRTHTGEKPYQCDNCTQRFAQKSHLVRHMRKHTGEKPYMCDICKELFGQKTDLVRHMRRHTGEKPYQCEICKERFARKSSLVLHMRTHIGDKSFKCDICKKCFTRKHHLKNHIRSHIV